MAPCRACLAKAFWLWVTVPHWFAAEGHYAAGGGWAVPTVRGFGQVAVPHTFRDVAMLSASKSRQQESPAEIKLGYESSEGRLAVQAKAADSSRVSQGHDKKQLFSLISGGLSGTIAATLTNPIEVLKTQLQSSYVKRGVGPWSVAQEVYRLEGVRGFFRGLPPTLVGIFPARASYFWAYSTSKAFLTKRMGEGDLTTGTAGLIAGLVGNTLTAPIWMVRTRMQLLADKATGQVVYTGYRNAIGAIYREEGIQGFYKGLSATLWGCSEGCIQFMVYERLKTSLTERQRAHSEKHGVPMPESLPSTHLLGIAALSKLIGTVCTYPHEVVRTRLREQARNGVFKYRGMWQSLSLIAKEEGRRGLYAGMGTHVLRVVPNTAIMFLSYELINKWLVDSAKAQPRTV